MSLFQNAVLNKYLNSLDKLQVDSAWEKFSVHFHDPNIQENIRNSNEIQYQGGFLIDLFVNVFGYIKNPAIDFNLTTELKNVKGGKKADGAILVKDEAIAVIELKGTNTIDLVKVETQAFGYKNNHPKCVYIITSNFEKLRFYIDNAVDFEEFDLFKLTRERFEILWLCLSADNLLRGVPKKIKDESITEGEIITKKLYKDYSRFRNETFDDISKNNPAYDKLTLFKKTQKLLDRFLFILFAEDKLLLPPNSIGVILKQWQDLQDEYDAYVPLYDRFKKYFGYLNTGFKGKKHDVFAYNGGLFLADEILDDIKIDDKLLSKHIKTLSNYDFASEVSVNILGHIFEHSLTEIENIQAQIAGEEIDKSKTKRKKDGVFYTPKYITKYIVDNTVGKLCAEKKAGLEIIEDAYERRKGRRQTTIDSLREKLDTYRKWLLKLTICDPACGSGAFLNQTLEFLIAEHRYIDELYTKLEGGSLILSDIENSILENNLFGVDINEESIEIAKLSLWLRTAQKGRKLTTLNDNIKCGNSLIDDPEIAGEKAFDWKQEFPKVFADGGFDVVIGNPPYVKLETVKELSRDIEKVGFKTFNKRGDLYCVFVEKGFDILKSNGLFSYIMPNKWLQAEYGKGLREYFLTKQLNQLIDFGDFQAFDGATTYPCIFIATDSAPNDQIKISVLANAGAQDFDTNVRNNLELFSASEFDEKTWVISSKKDKELLGKLNTKCRSLAEHIEGRSFRGVLTGLTKAFIIDENTRNELIKEDEKALELLKPVLRGRDIEKWHARESGVYLIGAFPALNIEIDKYQSIKNYLFDFGKERLEQSGKKGSRKKTSNKWFETQDSIDYWKEFHKPKIMYQKFQVKPCFIYDEQGLYCNDSMWIIPTENKALLGVLNSKMGWWLITKYCTQIQNGCQLIWKYFGQIPIPDLDEDLTGNVEKTLTLNEQFHEKKSAFLSYLQSQYPIEKFSKKLQSWHGLEFGEFIKELNKAIKKSGGTKLTKSAEMEWMELFETKKAEAQELKTKIDKTDREIDEMVYELYGLTEEEIAIVEGSNS